MSDPSNTLGMALTRGLEKSIYMQGHPTFDPLFTSKILKLELRRETLSKTSWTVRNLCPNGYGTLVH
jgi:hypothetical protein